MHSCLQCLKSLKIYENLKKSNFFKICHFGFTSTEIFILKWTILLHTVAAFCDFAKTFYCVSHYIIVTIGLVCYTNHVRCCVKSVTFDKFATVTLAYFLTRYENIHFFCFFWLSIFVKHNINSPNLRKKFDLAPPPFSNIFIKNYKTL